jgi:hypothetical protein
MFMLPSSTALHTLRQFGKIAKLDFGPCRQTLARLVRAIDPDGAESEIGGARDVPSIRADEADPRRRHAQVLDRQLIDARMRFENADGFDREYPLELCGKIRRLDRRLQHGRRAVREDGGLESRAADRSQHGRHFRIGAQFPVGLKKPLAQRRIRDGVALAGIVERLRRQLPEIGMRAHQTAQPAVLQLLAPPGGREGIRLRSEGITPPRRRAVHIEQRAVGIEHDGIDGGEAERWHALAISEEMQRGLAQEG